MIFWLPLEEDPDLRMLQQQIDAWEGEDLDTCTEADAYILPGVRR